MHNTRTIDPNHQAHQLTLTVPATRTPAPHQRHAPPGQRRRYRDDRALARSRNDPNHTHLRARRPRPQGTSNRSNRDPRKPSPADTGHPTNSSRSSKGCDYVERLIRHPLAQQKGNPSRQAGVQHSRARDIQRIMWKLHITGSVRARGCDPPGVELPAGSRRTIADQRPRRAQRRAACRTGANRPTRHDDSHITPKTRVGTPITPQQSQRSHQQPRPHVTSPITCKVMVDGKSVNLVADGVCGSRLRPGGVVNAPGDRSRLNAWVLLREGRGEFSMSVREPTVRRLEPVDSRGSAPGRDE